MAYPNDQQINTGAFVPTTNVWDTSEIYELKDIDDDFRNLLVRLYQNLNLMSEVLNVKDTGYYLQQQFVPGKLYFNPADPDPLKLRPGFRFTMDTDALAAGLNTIQLPFQIPITTATSTAWTAFFVNGAATNTTAGSQKWVPLPFAGATGNNIEVIVNTLTNPAQIEITNNSGFTFDRSNITLEFVKI
jgi:hypothetical protein